MHTRLAFRLMLAVILAWGLPALPVQARQAPKGQATDEPPAVAAAKALLASEKYVAPPPEIARLVAAPRHLQVTLNRPSPDRRYFLAEESEGLPRVSAFGKLHHYFGGLQVDPAANRARALTTRGAAGFKLIEAATGRATTITAPTGATVSSPAWSPDGTQLAYIANFETASHVFVADVATGRARQVTRTPLLATLVTTVDWTADGRNVVAVLVPAGRKPEPVRPAIATGPLVQLWMDSVKTAERNHASLLQDPFDQELMEYFVTGQLTLIDVRTRAVRPVGAPAMIERVDVSPDGQHFHVTTMLKPFSYVVPATRFAEVSEIWDASGKVLAEIARQPVWIGLDSTRTRNDSARRDVAWMPSGPGLYFVQRAPAPRGADTTGPAERGGRGGTGGVVRPDRVVLWLPPFDSASARVLYTHEGPISDLVFSDDAQTLFVASTRNGTGEIVAVTVAEPAKKQVVVRQRGYTPSFTGEGRAGQGGFGGGGARGGGDDSLAFYTNPGAMLTKRGTRGTGVALVSGDGAVFLRGIRYDRNWEANAPRPFVDKVVLASGNKSRVYEGPADAHEALGAPLDDDLTRVVVTRESPTQVPDSWLVDTRSGARTRLTANTDLTPEFTRMQRKRLWVTRADGVRFLVKVTLPADYRAGTRLPGMLWLYPYEYTDQAGYERSLRTENINQFPSGGTRTIEYLATQGYIVANFNPPIIGEAGRMNDNFVSDLRMNLLAVIDELDRQGWVDRSRMAIGGHSYGAFSTANALVHTPFFKAGIAGDGMYNRTLTPNGFQSERRDLWSGQQTYLDLSPMLYVDQMQGALLMYHGLEDQNVGTAPISSIRMMQALRAHGKPSSLFMYPYEDHGPATEETLLDLWARWTAWLEVYVKHPSKGKLIS